MIRVLKVFRFTNNERSRVIIGTGARLHPKLNKLMLKLSGGGYPTGPDIQVATWLSVPRSVKKWLVFFADSVTPKDGSNIQVTHLGYRLSDDGVTPLYWDGATWRAPVGSEWNTDAEVNVGIESFPVSNTAIQVIINLRTDDPAFTPEVTEVRLAYESDVHYQEDYIRSLLRLIREQVRPISEYQLEADGPTDTVDLNAIETPYNIVGADSAFDATADPNLQTDLLAGFDPVTKEVTLSTPVPDGNTIQVRFLYEPEVALTTSQDYTELDKVPAIVIDDVTTGQSHEVSMQHVINKATGGGLAWDSLFQVDIEVPMRMVTDKAVDQQRLADAMKTLFASNPFLVSLARDERYRLWMTDEYDQLTFPAQSELHSGRLRARIAKALFSPTDARTITGVKRVIVTGGNLELEAP